MGLFTKSVKPDKVTVLKMVTETGNGFYAWNGKLYESDIIRSCIRPKSEAIGKLSGRHLLQTKTELKVNPEPYMRFLLEEPNPYMIGQMMQEKMNNQLDLNSNAFAAIIRNENDLAYQLYPITCSSAQTLYDATGELFLKFSLNNGTFLTIAYTDVIHIRKDFNENDIFGTSPTKALSGIMEVVTTTDQGTVKAIKNSAAIRWLLKFSQKLKPEDVQTSIDSFVKNYLSIDSDNVGVAATDPGYEAQQIKPESYVPNAAMMDRSKDRLYDFFGTNKNIVQSSWSQDQWIAYYESKIEPVALQMSQEYTRKLFSRRQRGVGNKILFEAGSLQYASMDIKLKFSDMVDRGAMTPNEWRNILNLGPVDGGDILVRRLDTATVKSTPSGGDE